MQIPSEVEWYNWTGKKWPIDEDNEQNDLNSAKTKDRFQRFNQP